MSEQILGQEKPSLESLIEHHGVKGMHWGHHKSGPLAGISRKTSHEAQKDAHEFARAKLFYGEGAGTRRKLIKASVEAKAKRDANYKKAFDHHLANQDLSEHAQKARSERRRKDATSKTLKTSRGVYRHVTGGFGAVSAASATIGTGYLLAKKYGVDQKLKTVAAQKYSHFAASSVNKKNMRAAQDFLRNMGM